MLRESEVLSFFSEAGQKAFYQAWFPAFGYISPFHCEDTASIGAKCKQFFLEYFERKIFNFRIFLYLQNLSNQRMNIKLTEIAEKTYFEIITKYSETKATSFSKNTVSIVHMIQQNNQIGSRYKKTSYRKFLISNQVYLFYKIEFQTIYIILFWDNKRNPASLDIILSS